MLLISFLIIAPLVAAGLLALVTSDSVRGPIVGFFAAAIAILSIALSVTFVGTMFQPIEFSSEILDYAALGISVLLACVVMAFSFKYKNWIALVLAIVQLVGSLYFELVVAHGVPVVYGLYVDSLSVIMALIIGIIGSGICVYAIGYMKDFQAHEPEGARDRRPTFFALMFLFLSAMFVIVFSNNMTWMFVGWEVTTVCSFLLIAFTRTEEAIANAFRQIIMNMIGGLAFLIAMFYSVVAFDTLSFNEFIARGLFNPELAAIPVCALVLAGLTKAAQMPFHTWLLGAMVAPTPTSALLHSSTMVKAGVFLLIKLAPLFQVCVAPAFMAIAVGGVTFMLCSFMAISQSNAKRVLAYSTIANLGLIVACAGVGTPESIWAAVLLVIFHACAKSLLFLCVGTAEHHIGSRDIEDMDLLFLRMPKLARFMMLGIMCMFVAPFGMLIAKWATLVSFAETGHVGLIILLAFGSAATFMFWAKWLGKLSGIADHPENVEQDVHSSEWMSLLLMAGLSTVACLTLPIMSRVLVEPYVVGIFGVLGESIKEGNLWITTILAVFVAVILFGRVGKQKKQADVYLAGAGTDFDNRIFKDSVGGQMAATSRNLYLENAFGEKRFKRVGEIACALFILVSVVLGFAAPMGF